MSGCMLSVLITTYNLEGCVSETIDSVLNQKLYCKYEILVGDDGSSDRTVDIINRYCKATNGLVKLYKMKRSVEDKKPAIVRASKNRINLALHASGKYIVFLDGDDVIINPHSLQTKIDILEKPENRDCVMCGSNFNLYYDKSGKCVPAKRFIIRNKINNKIYWKSGLWIHAEVNVIRNIIDFNHIENEYINPSFFDDNLILFAYLKHGNIYYINSIDVNYRQNNAGYFNWKLGKRLFVSLLIYCHANYFTSSINQNMRLYSVLKNIYYKNAEISKELLKSVPYYGFSVANIIKTLNFWTIKTHKRDIIWIMISIIHQACSGFFFAYLYGIKSAINHLICKNHS